MNGIPSLLVGNLTGDPELSFSKAGKPYCRLSVANTPRVKKDDQWEDGATTFVTLTVFDTLAENAAASLLKGFRIMAWGELEKRLWTDKDGNERESMELNNVTYLGPELRFAQAMLSKASKGGNARPQAQQGAPQGYGPPQNYGPPQGAPQGAPPQGYPQGQMPPQQGQMPQQAPQQAQQWQQPQQGWDETPF